ncbi:MAG: hypothetical protein ABR573_08655 [Candidatus Dormibacteria bacterium]
MTKVGYRTNEDKILKEAAMTDRESDHPEDLPWNDSPADSLAPLGSHDPEPGEVTDDSRDLSGTNIPDDPYRRDTLDERLAEESPESEIAPPEAAFEIADVGRGDEGRVAPLDRDDTLRSPAQAAEESAIHVVDDDRI